MKILQISDQIEDLYSLEDQTKRSMIGALVYCRNVFKPSTQINGQIISGGCSQFVNEKEEAPSATGTSSLLIAMLNCGESVSSEIVTKCRNLLLEQSRDDGSWSKPSLQSSYGLIRETYFVLKALLDSGHPPNSPEVVRCIQWIANAQNDDGGWGNLARDNTSDVTGTSYCLQMLAREGESVSYTNINSVITKGLNWLQTAMNEDASWGKSHDHPGTLAHTAHAIDALTACGVDDLILKSTKEWLLRNCQMNSQFVEHYTLPIPRPDRERLIWTQLPDERALIALLKLGVGVESTFIQQAVQNILKRQVGSTYWRIESMPDTEQIWATMEAVISLRIFLDYLDRHGATIMLAESIKQLENQIESQNAQIKGLEERLLTNSLKNKFARFVSFLNNPLLLIGLGSIILTGVYILLRGYYQFPNLADTIAGILGIIGFFLSFYQVYEIVRNKHENN